MSKVFLFKDNSEDRDCVAYIENKPLWFECNHYFGGIDLQGACYSRGFKDISYDDIKTILSKEEFNSLIEFDKKIDELGYGIEKGSEKYNIGVELCNKIQPIYNKLNSEENEKLFKEVIEEEKEYLSDEFNLDKDDIETIFDNYGLEYRDRAVVGSVYNSIKDCSYEEAEQYGCVTKENERWFDYDKFGEDLLENEQYLELSDGRVVYLCY